MVFQYPESQLFGETVAEDIAYGAKNRGFPPEMVRERVRQAMACVGLDESYLPRSPYLLSGGEKRRVAIAGILAMAPQVLILDEPTAGLDAKGRQEFQAMLAAWRQQENTTILWVSHDMSELAQVTDRVFVLFQGQLIWDGSLRLALQKPEIWQKAGLALPPSAQLVQHLAARGCPLDASAITPEQAVESLNNWARGKKHESSDALGPVLSNGFTVTRNGSPMQNCFGFCLYYYCIFCTFMASFSSSCGNGFWCTFFK